MGVVKRSSAAVESYLSALDETYGSFSVNQTTLAVETSRYEHEREKAGAGRVDIYTKVHNDQSEVLHLQQEETLELPSATVSDKEFESAATSAVEDRTGIECEVTGIDQATILGVRDINDDSRETVYRLAIVFEATHNSGSVDNTAVWEKQPTEFEPVYV